MNRNLGIDLFRIIAMFTVVLIHSACTDVAFRDGVLRWLPPANACFAFIAGWFLFKTCEDLTPRSIVGLIGKRLKRLVLPYLVWVGVYVLANIGFDLLQGKFQLLALQDWVGIVFGGSGSVQLWFVITLVYAQIVLCGIMVAIVAISCKFVKGFLTAWLFVLLAIGVLLWRMSGIENDYLRRFAFLLGYGALGVGLRYAVHEVRGIMKESICIGVALIGCGLVVLARFIDIPEFMRVLAWCVMFGCMPVHASLQKCLAYGSEAVMGIYLCHVLFTRVIALGVPAVSRLLQNGYMLVVFNAIIGFSASLAFVLLVKRTRLQRYLSI